MSNKNPMKATQFFMINKKLYKLTDIIWLLYS